MKADFERRGLKPFDVCLALGQYDEALARIEREVSNRNPIATSLKADPVYDPVRSDARFQRLLKRVGSRSRAGWTAHCLQGRKSAPMSRGAADRSVRATTPTVI